MKTHSTGPLLAGTLARKAGQLLQRIAADLMDAPPPVGPYLSSGAAGRGLVLDELACALGDRKIAVRAGRLLEDACQALGRGVHGPGLFQGFPGVGVAVAQRPGRRARRLSLEEIDRGVLAAIQTRTSDQFDLVSGLAGMGLYLLERLPDPAALAGISAIVERLSRSASNIDGAVCWLTPPWTGDPDRHASHPAGVFDLAMAHGTAGVVAFLARAQLAAPHEHTCQLLTRAVTWILRRQGEGCGPSIFPDFVSVSQQRADTRPSRAAWCYGDPGIAWALWNAGLACQRPDWQLTATEILRAVSARPAASCMVIDACLCHGAAGLAHLLHRMYRRTGDPMLAQSARRWLDQVCRMATRKTAPAGLLFWNRNAGSEPVKWRVDRSLLSGSAGVALVLAAALADREPRWDRLLGL